MGSAGVASIVAHVTFWILVGWGLVAEELRPAIGGTFVALWLAGLAVAPYVPLGEALVPSYVAVLDIVLVFLLFGGDVRRR